MSDYRQICVLPAFSKIFEKIVANKLAAQVETNILPVFQSGFRKSYSTATALMNIVGGIYPHNDKVHY